MPGCWSATILIFLVALLFLCCAEAQGHGQREDAEEDEGLHVDPSRFAPRVKRSLLSKHFGHKNDRFVMDFPNSDTTSGSGASSLGQSFLHSKIQHTTLRREARRNIQLSRGQQPRTGNTATRTEEEEAGVSPSYLGCRAASATQSMTPYLYLKSADMTVSVCADLCIESGQYLAALSEGDRCYCAKASSVFGLVADEANCSVTCTGVFGGSEDEECEGDYCCGGHGFFAVYSVALLNPASQLLQSAATNLLSNNCQLLRKLRSVPAVASFFWPTVGAISASPTVQCLASGCPVVQASPTYKSTNGPNTVGLNIGNTARLAASNLDSINSDGTWSICFDMYLSVGVQGVIMASMVAFKEDVLQGWAITRDNNAASFTFALLSPSGTTWSCGASTATQVWGNWCFSFNLNVGLVAYLNGSRASLTCSAGAPGVSYAFIQPPGTGMTLGASPVYPNMPACQNVLVQNIRLFDYELSASAMITTTLPLPWSSVVSPAEYLFDFDGGKVPLSAMVINPGTGADVSGQMAFTDPPPAYEGGDAMVLPIPAGGVLRSTHDIARTFLQSSKWTFGFWYYFNVTGISVSSPLASSMLFWSEGASSSSDSFQVMVIWGGYSTANTFWPGAHYAIQLQIRINNVPYVFNYDLRQSLTAAESRIPLLAYQWNHIIFQRAEGSTGMSIWINGLQYAMTGSSIPTSAVSSSSNSFFSLDINAGTPGAIYMPFITTKYLLIPSSFGDFVWFGSCKDLAQGQAVSAVFASTDDDGNMIRYSLDLSNDEMNDSLVAQTSPDIALNMINIVWEEPEVLLQTEEPFGWFDLVLSNNASRSSNTDAFHLLRKNVRWNTETVSEHSVDFGIEFAFAIGFFVVVEVGMGFEHGEKWSTSDALQELYVMEVQAAPGTTTKTGSTTQGRVVTQQNWVGTLAAQGYLTVGSDDPIVVSLEEVLGQSQTTFSISGTTINDQGSSVIFTIN